MLHQWVMFVSSFNRNGDKSHDGLFAKEVVAHLFEGGLNTMKDLIKSDLSPSDVIRIKQSKAIAIDTETGGLNPYRDSLYLIQICDQEGVIDLIRNPNWKSAVNLISIFEDPSIVKVMHFAIMDCAFLLSNVGIVPEHVFCTKITSKIARTYASSHSLSSLIEELLGKTIDKKKQQSFWGRDHLTNDQIEYASNDVRHLLEIKTKLDEILQQKGLLPTGNSYEDLNRQCQAFIPTLVHLWVNGWDFGKEDQNSIFGV